jgi:hypothetical protein
MTGTSHQPQPNIDVSTSTLSPRLWLTSTST